MQASDIYHLPSGVRHRIPDWKQEYRHVYAVSIDTSWDTPMTCVFRVLTRDEMKYVEEAQPYRDEWWSEGWIIGHCLLYPHPTVLDEWQAGAVDCLGGSILDASGWTSAPAIEETLALARQNTGTLDSAMVSYILKAFPSMKAEDLGSMHFFDLIYYVAQAEVILGQQLQIDMWLNPRKFERSLRRARKHQGGRVNIPGNIPQGPDGFETPAEAMYSESELRRKPQLAFQQEVMEEDTMLAAGSGKKLTSADAIMNEMVAQRSFLAGGGE